MRWTRERARARLVMWAGLPLSFAVMHASPARAADGGRIRELLRVEPGATCLAAPRLAEHVEQWLQDADIEDGVSVVVRGDASDPRSARLEVMRKGRVVAHRAFEPGPVRCAHLQAAIGLAIALALKANLVEELSRPLPDDPVTRSYGWALAGAGMLTYRVLPELAPGVELSARRAFGEHLALRVGALAVGALDLPLAQQTGTFDAVLTTARVEACGQQRLSGALRGGLCLGVAGGTLRASGAEVENPESSIVGWLALSNAVELELELSRHWSLTLAGSAFFLLHDLEVGTEDSAGTRVGRKLASTAFGLGLGPLYYF